nr:MAG TPA: hypothetical protein [Caudoviricetes sp.]
MLSNLQCVSPSDSKFQWSLNLNEPSGLLPQVIFPSV